MQNYFIMNSKKDKTRCPKGHGDMTQGNSYRRCPVSVQIQKHKMLYIESRSGSEEELRDTKTNQDKVTVCEYSSQAASIFKTRPLGFLSSLLQLMTHLRNLLIGHLEKALPLIREF